MHHLRTNSLVGPTRRLHQILLSVETKLFVPCSVHVQSISPPKFTHQPSASVLLGAADLANIADIGNVEHDVVVEQELPQAG